MKKERMITRTIKNTSALVKVYDMEKDEITSTWLDITGNIGSEDELAKACENRLKGSDYKLLKVVDKMVTEKLYGMSESLFMLYAVELEPRVKDDSQDSLWTSGENEG